MRAANTLVEGPMAAGGTLAAPIFLTTILGLSTHVALARLARSPCSLAQRCYDARKLAVTSCRSDLGCQRSAPSRIEPPFDWQRAPWTAPNPAAALVRDAGGYLGCVAAAGSRQGAPGAAAFKRSARWAAEHRRVCPACSERSPQRSELHKRRLRGRADLACSADSCRPPLCRPPPPTPCCTVRIRTRGQPRASQRGPHSQPLPEGAAHARRLCDADAGVGDARRVAAGRRARHRPAWPGLLQPAHPRLAAPPRPGRAICGLPPATQLCWTPHQPGAVGELSVGPAADRALLLLVPALLQHSPVEDALPPAAPCRPPSAYP